MITPLLTPYTIPAMLSYGALVSGLCLIKNKKMHALLMGIGIIADFILVIALEIGRHVFSIIASQHLSYFLIGHIITSSCAVVLYIPILILGYQIYRTQNSKFESSPWYTKIVLLAFVFRSIGFILMFAMIAVK